VTPQLDRQLYNWMINLSLDVVDDLLQSLTCVIQEGPKVINSLRRVEQNLPADEGRRRPMDEARFIIYLADQFEASGGFPVAYNIAYHNEKAGSAFAKTSFRNFVHRFYEMLPIESKRTQIGLDKEILRALKYRRRH
jgi:hypothetical protein